MQLIYFDRFVLKEMEMLSGTKYCRRVRDRIYIHRWTRWKKVKQITKGCLQITEQRACWHFSNKLLTNVVKTLGFYPKHQKFWPKFVIMKAKLSQTNWKYLLDLKVCSTMKNCSFPHQVSSWHLMRRWGFDEGQTMKVGQWTKSEPLQNCRCSHSAVVSIYHSPTVI